jgi:hypothetical protein
MDLFSFAMPVVVFPILAHSYTHGWVLAIGTDFLVEEVGGNGICIMAGWRSCILEFTRFDDRRAR